jgi:hypothetical protein
MVQSFKFPAFNQKVLVHGIPGKECWKKIRLFADEANNVSSFNSISRI